MAQVAKTNRVSLRLQQNLPMCSGRGMKQVCLNHELLRHTLPADKTLTPHSWRAQIREVCASGLRGGSDLLLGIPWPADEGELLTGQDSVIQLHRKWLISNGLGPWAESRVRASVGSPSSGLVTDWAGQGCALPCLLIDREAVFLVLGLEHVPHLGGWFWRTELHLQGI